MPSINVLPVHLVNKIAAGEVIERPASVVKELVENAIDSGATRIDVAIEDGGKKLISVSDNGSGMDAADLALAFVPHATSKISGEDDLFAIRSMGFRGEALASIASISHAHIRTRRRGEDGGFEIIASGQEISSPSPCAASPGTTVTIRDLFFNTPARRKFLKTSQAEFSQISEQFARIALANPAVAMTLTHNGRKSANLPSGDSMLTRISDLFGKEIADGLIQISRDGRNAKISGFIAPPSAARATSQWQYVFLNGRYIRDRLLSHAIKEAYRGRIEHTRWPVVFMFVAIDPAEVDVNVHPTKIEVRFRDGQSIHGEMLAAMKDSLNRVVATSPTMDQLGAAKAPQADAADKSQADGSAPTEDDRRQSVRQALADFFRSAPPPQPRLTFPDTRDGEKFRPAGQYSPPTVQRHAEFPPSADAETFRRPADSDNPPQVAEQSPPIDLPAAMQVHNSFIIAQVDEGVIVIDQHALHERLMYNEITCRFSNGTLSSQRLLIPATIKLSPADLAIIEDRQELFRKIGIEIARFGPNSGAIQSFPELLTRRGVGPEEFVREILDMIAEDETAGAEHIFEKIISMMACKAAVKAGDKLSSQEMAELIARSGEAEKASACPHGRPTTIILTLTELYKLFRRT